MKMKMRETQTQIQHIQMHKNVVNNFPRTVEIHTGTNMFAFGVVFIKCIHLGNLYQATHSSECTNVPATFCQWGV